MIESLFWGLVGASSLLIGALVAMWLRINRRLLGLIMAFGVGVLISAVAYELVEEAYGYAKTTGGIPLVIGLAAGALTFFTGDILIDRLGGEGRKRADAKHESGSGPAILLGTILDGIPESMVIGLTFLRGGTVSVAMVVAVFLSNLPEAIGATSGLVASGWKRWKIVGLWVVVVLISGLASLLGYVLFDTASPGSIAFTLAFAAGALLTMLADTMAPEAYKDSGKLVGLVTTLGFGLAFALSILD
jgi:ZIP family zinc transporter